MSYNDICQQKETFSTHHTGLIKWMMSEHQEAHTILMQMSGASTLNISSA